MGRAPFLRHLICRLRDGSGNNVARGAAAPAWCVLVVRSLCRVTGYDLRRPRSLDYERCTHGNMTHDSPGYESTVAIVTCSAVRQTAVCGTIGLWGIGIPGPLKSKARFRRCGSWCQRAP